LGLLSLSLLRNDLCCGLLTFTLPLSGTRALLFSIYLRFPTSSAPLHLYQSPWFVSINPAYSPSSNILAVTVPRMPPQKIVTTSKRGRGTARPRKSKGANRSKPTLRAKPNSNQADSHNQHGATPAQFINHDQDEKTEAEAEREVDNLPIAESVGGTRRSTRAPKKRHDDDHVFGSELEHHVNLISVRKADDREDGNFQAMSSSLRK
jgi:hypothetical protein